MGRIFVVIGGLLVLVLSLALVVPPFIDWTNYRDRFEQEASRILGRAVHVNGSASARLLPFPSVTFADVVVEGDEGQAALTMDQFSMDAELLPFLRGQILIFDMRMEKPQLDAELDHQGRLNWKLPVKSELTGAQVRLEKLTLHDGIIRFADEMSGRKQQFDAINATLSADSLAGPWRINAHLQADGQPLSVEMTSGENKAGSPLSLAMRIVPDQLAVALETDGALDLEQDRPVYKGQFSFATLQSDSKKPLKQSPEQSIIPGTPSAALTLDQLRLSGQFEAQPSGIQLPEFRMEQGDAAAPYVINGKARFEGGDHPHFMISADGQQVYLNGARPQTGVQQSQPEAVQPQVPPELTAAEKLRLFKQLVERIPVPDIAGHIDLRLPAIIAGGTVLRSVIIRAEPDQGGWAISQLQADLPGRTQIEAKGRLQLGQDFGFTGNFLLASRQPAGFASWLTGDKNTALYAQLPAAGFSGAISLQDRLQKIDKLEIVLGETVLNGAFERSIGANDIASSLLNIDGVNREGKALDVANLQLLSRLLIRDGAFSALAGENLTVNLKAGPVQFAQLTADTLDTSFRLNGGKLDFDRLMISGLEGATLSATGSLRPFDPSVNAALDATIMADELEPLLRQLQQALPDNALVAALAARAAAYPQLLSASKIDLILNAVNLFADNDPQTVAGKAVSPDDEPNEENAAAPQAKAEAGRSRRLQGGQQQGGQQQGGKPDLAELSFSLNGRTAAMILSVAGSSKGTLTGAEPMQLSLTANAKAQSGEAVMALLGLPVVPLGLMGEAEINLQAQGIPANGMKAELDFRGDDGHGVLNGVVTLANDELTASGRANLQSDDLEPVLATTGYALPFGRGFGAGLPVQLASDFQFGKNIIRLPNLQGQVDDQAISARLDGSLSDQAVVQLRGDLQVESFDVPVLLAAMTGLPLAEIDNLSEKNWSKTAFGNSSSLPMGLDVKVKAAKAQWTAAQTMTDFAMRVVKKDQTLQLSEIGGQWAKGKISGKLELNNAGGTLLGSADLRLSGADLALLYQPETFGAALNGEADIKLSASGSGKSMAELVAGLGGEGDVSVTDIRIAGINPAVRAEVLSRMDGLSDQAAASRTDRPANPEKAENEIVDLAKLFSGSGQLQAEKLQAPLTLAGGVLRAPALKIQNEQALLQADLQFDLNRLQFAGNGAVEMLLPVAERNDVAPQLQFSLNGGWNTPQIHPDYQPMVQFLTRRGLLREQLRVEAAQALIIEKQRLKREAAYYAAQRAEQQRLRQEQEEQQRRRAEAEANAAKAAEAARQYQLQQTMQPKAPDLKPSLDEFLQNLPAD